MMLIPTHICHCLFSASLSEYHDAFAMHDLKNNGYITNLELKNLLRSSGFNPTDTEIDQMCLEVDYNGLLFALQLYL